MSKVFCEYVIIRYNLFFNINYSIIRLPNIFGYWPSKKNFSQDILNQLISSKKIIKVNNLNGSLETIYINDFLSNLYYVLSDISRFKNKIIDFRSDKKITLKNFLKNIIRAYDPKDKIVIKNLNKKNMNNSVNLDYCKIKKNYVIKNSKYSGKNIYNGIKKLINQSKLNGKN